MTETMPQISTSSLNKTLRAMLWCIIASLVVFVIIAITELISDLTDIPVWIPGTLSFMGWIVIGVCLFGIAILTMMLVVILFIKACSLLHKNTPTQ